MADGQLSKLDQFVAKDPFKQQLAVKGSTDAPTGTDKTSTTPDSPVPPTDPTSTTSTPTPTPPVANATIATISVNGTSEDVQAGGTFPKSAAQPYFQLVSLGSSSVKIGIAGGSLAGGGQTVTLAKGKKLTLMNTADGTKSVLQLLALK